MHSIEISNRQSTLPIDAPRLTHAAEIVLAGEQIAVSRRELLQTLRQRLPAGVESGEAQP